MNRDLQACPNAGVAPTRSENSSGRKVARRLMLGPRSVVWCCAGLSSAAPVVDGGSRVIARGNGASPEHATFATQIARTHPTSARLQRRRPPSLSNARTRVTGYSISTLCVHEVFLLENHALGKVNVNSQVGVGCLRLLLKAVLCFVLLALEVRATARMYLSELVTKCIEFVIKIYNKKVINLPTYYINALVRCRMKI